MLRSADQLLAEALDLPLEDRAHLAEYLISSLEDIEDVDAAQIEREWMAELSKRAAEIDSGTVRTEPATEVFRAARAEL